MSFTLTVVTHPTADISKPSVIIEDRSSGDRTVIGKIPAGFQRKCNEMSLKTSRLTNIFLSGILNWESVAGLPGLILTVSDQGAKSLGINHSGNKLIQYIVSCWRYFIFRFGIDLNVNDVDNTVEKGSVKYKPINITSRLPTEDNSNKEEDHIKLENIVGGIFPFQNNSSKPQYNAKRLANLTLPESIVNPRISTSWIITPNPIRGKFMVNVAKQLGCQIPHFKPLCNFESVVLENGTTITPEQVLEPTRYFNSVLVLDIPSEEYLENTLSHDFLADLPNELPYSCVFHFIGDEIKDPLADPKYIDFIRKFGPSTLHFVSHKSYCPNVLNFLKTFRVSMKWKSLLSKFFPLPKWSFTSSISIDEQLPNVLPMISGQTINIKSTTGTNLEDSTKAGLGAALFSTEDAKTLYKNEIESVFSDSLSSSEFNKVIENVHTAESLRKTVDLTKSLKDQIETLILGTGSAIPSNIRNVLCNIVRVPYVNSSGESGFRTIVLDAGEGSFGTLQRTYKKEEVKMLLDELKMIYLSHLHADHHLGIIDFIKQWNKHEQNEYGFSRSKVLYVVTPWQYDKFLRELNKVDEIVDLKYIKYVSCDEFMVGYIAPSFEQHKIEDVPVEKIGTVKQTEIEFTKNEEVSNDLYSSVGMSEIKTCAAFHCEYAYSCSLSFKLNLDSPTTDDNVFQISYSGDTRPKSTFSFIGRNSDLLIHESTLDDDKLGDAISKRHSTTSEALQVGILMKAKKIILTHFSQRYKSFTCSSEVYARLSNPKTREDFTETEGADNLQVKQRKSIDSIAEIDESLPIELQSNIFSESIDEDVRKNAAQMEVLFAFDNMHVQYSDFGKQREVFEKYGTQLEKLFSDDWDDVEDEPIVSEDNQKGQKKQNKQKDNNSTKKRKLTPPM
ncbi:hypothetical protein CANINC_001549 [Pichia inconspicua]|uniref:ribonuclease Z n=1 Tax=Pichia inconspicua TaxID=52247 RepID=A0A4T0X3D2_9ASCO|nr:hypothetical protein CANINC_001549 [[Candida] inconspicua]